MAGKMSSGMKLHRGDLDSLASDILTRARIDGMFSVAVAGPPGSGKSTLAAALAKKIGSCCCVIPMDGFHLDNVTLEARGLLSVKGAPETFDLVGFKRLINGLQSGVAKSFPTFDRDVDSVVENGGSLSDEVSVLLFEGNYLLFDEDGWTDLADGWDASIWLEVPADVLQERLTRRWLDQGMSMEAALARAQGNDLVNARRVIEKALPATWIVST
jgi:fructokinase